MMEGPRAGRRIIGQVVGHEINLEIEGVQDKKIILKTNLNKTIQIIEVTLFKNIFIELNQV